MQEKLADFGLIHPVIAARHRIHSLPSGAPSYWGDPGEAVLRQYKNQTNIGVGIGFALSIVARVLARQQPSFAILSLGLLVISAGLIVWGCSGYAKGKGYSGWWGLLGLLSVLGFVILFLFPDKNKTS